MLYIFTIFYSYAAAASSFFQYIPLTAPQAHKLLPFSTGILLHFFLLLYTNLIPPLLTTGFRWDNLMVVEVKKRQQFSRIKKNAKPNTKFGKPSSFSTQHRDLFCWQKLSVRTFHFKILIDNFSRDVVVVSEKTGGAAWW